MNRIDTLFQRARQDERKAFVPFLAAGDPDLETTERVAVALGSLTDELGVPMILELGFPYSDPIADGPTIQTSYTRALDHGVRVAGILETCRKIRDKADFPIVAMVSYAIVFRNDPVEFLSNLQKAGFDGAIIPDLPVEESASVHDWGEAHDFKIIQLVAPTTRADRIGRIASASTGFIYYISVTGITGERTALPADLVDRVELLRKEASVPICIGFGISEPEHVRSISGVADGVIVGSTLVRRVSALKANADLAPVLDFVRGLVEPLTRR